MGEEAGSRVLAAGFFSKSQVNAFLKIYIKKRVFRNACNSYLQILSSWRVVAGVVTVSVNAPRVPTWAENHGHSGSDMEVRLARHLMFGAGQWQTSVKTVGWACRDASPEHPASLQQFGAQRFPQVVSALLISLDADSSPFPDALRANTRQTVHWRRDGLCQCESRKHARKRWSGFPRSGHRLTA